VQAIRALEALVGDMAATRATRGHGRPGLFQSAAPVQTPDGPKWPCLPIDEVLTWAHTERGGRQLRLGDWGREDGCVRWGMCDTELTSPARA
jgi:hypothetical protein